jgi:hypothetical protein
MKIQGIDDTPGTLVPGAFVSVEELRQMPDVAPERELTPREKKLLRVQQLEETLGTADTLPDETDPEEPQFKITNINTGASEAASFNEFLTFFRVPVKKFKALYSWIQDAQLNGSNAFLIGKHRVDIVHYGRLKIAPCSLVRVTFTDTNKEPLHLSYVKFSTAVRELNISAESGRIIRKVLAEARRQSPKDPEKWKTVVYTQPQLDGSKLSFYFTLLP